MTTYYVDGAVGSDSNLGTSEGAGNAWLTINKGMDTAQTAGDVVYVKASATYNETVRIDSGSIGTSLAPMTYEGYTTTPGDNGKATIDGATNCLTSGVSIPYMIFKNIKFINASGAGIDLNTTDALAFYNCEFNSNGGDGVHVDGGQNNNCIFVSCIAHSNGGLGISLTSGGIFGCIAYGNSGNQLETSTGPVNACLVYSPSASTSMIKTSSWHGTINCTVDGDNIATVIGIENTSATSNIVNNIIYDCTTGVFYNIAPNRPGAVAAFNLMNSNTTDYSHTGYATGYQDVTSAPAFNDEANDDYTLSNLSPAIDAGIQPGGIT